MNSIFIKEGSELSELLKPNNELPSTFNMKDEKLWRKFHDQGDYIMDRSYKEIKGYIKLRT